MPSKIVKSNGEDSGQFKIYKEKCYPNSEGNPFGLTINGRSKEYIVAHEAFKDMIIKGKKYSIEETKISILDVTKNKSMLNAVVEISEKQNDKGNVNLKVYNPSLNKRKGATIELRKITDFVSFMSKKL